MLRIGWSFIAVDKQEDTRLERRSTAQACTSLFVLLLGWNNKIMHKSNDMLSSNVLSETCIIFSLRLGIDGGVIINKQYIHILHSLLSQVFVSTGSTTNLHRDMINGIYIQKTL